MIKIISFGYLHGVPEGYDLLLDVRDLVQLQAQQVNAEMTGRDDAMRDAVMSTPGAAALIDLLVDAVILGGGFDRDLTVVIGSQHGRHRSVVLANQLGDRLFAARCSVDQRDRDIDRPAVAG